MCRIRMNVLIIEHGGSLTIIRAFVEQGLIVVVCARTALLSGVEDDVLLMGLRQYIDNMKLPLQNRLNISIYMTKLMIKINYCMI